jgi:hypothetical protein
LRAIERFVWRKNAMINQKLQDIAGKDSYYTILLSHKPELIDVYFINSINLVLSNHVYGLISVSLCRWDYCPESRDFTQIYSWKICFRSNKDGCQ